MSAIIGIPLQNNIEDATKLQEILIKYGCTIKTRLGIHNMGEYRCNNQIIVIIEITDNVNEIYDCLSQYWQVQIMKF